jgi:hypothetical protein
MLSCVKKLIVGIVIDVKNILAALRGTMDMIDKEITNYE